MPEWITHWLRDARLMVSFEVVIVAISTGVAIVLARGLGPSDWGLFSGLLGLSIALSTFVSLGLGTWLLRELSRLHSDTETPEARSRLSSPLLLGGVIASTTSGVLVAVAAAIVLAAIGASTASTVTLLALLGYTVCLAVTTCLEAHLRAERRLRRIVIGMMLERTLLLGLAVLIVSLTSGIWAVGVAYLLAGSARTLVIGYTVFVDERLPILLPNLRRVPSFVRRSIPFALNSLSIAAIPKLDTLVVTSASALAAGYFALGDRVIGPASFVPVVASMALYPYLARERPESRTAWKISAGMMVVGALVAVIGAALAPLVVPAVFGGDYADAVSVVQIMLFAVPFVYVIETLLVHLYTIHRELMVLGATLVASIAGTIAVLVGAHSLGAEGAAIGYLFRQALFFITLAGIAVTSSRRQAAFRETRA